MNMNANAKAGTSKERSKKEPKKAKTRRGDPEVIEKRRIARQFNALFSEAYAAKTAPTDRRVLKRLEHLKKKLQGGQLKVIEVLKASDELLEHGETLKSLRELKPKVPKAPPLTPEALNIIIAAQAEYQFDPRSWSLVGVSKKALAA